ncbi:MAG TPA: proline--tRNA ligase [Aggregatilineaceae bacterium]|nr:proline--tRNA ligase [Aggregatilineaceae bacterium]
MKLAHLFTRTLRDAPSDAEMVNHQLAVRAGLVRLVAAGSYALMPLGRRVIQKIEGILRDEINRIDGQEIRMPVVQPAEIFQASGRWDSFGPVLQKIKNGSGREFALGPTHEDVVAFLAEREIDSYKQLPQHVYQIQTKYRNEARPRGGLIRLREFTMKDSYSLHTDYADLDRFYERMVGAYRRICERVQIDVFPVEADTGVMGGRDSHEFVMLHDQGEALVVVCDQCGYAANTEAAAFRLDKPEAVEWEAVQKVATPDCTSIQEVADFIGVPTNQTLKAVFFVNEKAGQVGEFVFVVIRGDLDVNEVKLINALGGGEVRPATDEEIRATGAVPGYASPMGLSQDVKVIADVSVRYGANFVAGANDAGYHFTGVNVPRDFDPAVVVDLAEPYEGAGCARCDGGHLHLKRAIEIGHCFKLGTRYSDVMDVTYQDEKGESHPVVMGSYGIGLERLMGLIIEAHHDDYGIIWPRCVAPFDVHIVVLGKEPEYVERAAQLHDELIAAGFDVLLDDRADCTAGVKFADADLIGVPVRLTVSKKALEAGCVEGKRRASSERVMVPLEQVVEWVGEE